MSNLDKSLENLSLDADLTLRHKKERKELQSKIQALKKTAGKGDKKKKKEVLEEIARLETDLDKRHADELANAEKTTANGDDTSQPDANQNQIESSDVVEEKTGRVSRAQKRREKKANEEKVRQADILAQDEINKTGARAIELNTIKKLLAKRDLIIHPIASDGNCLYNAIRNQLQVTDRFVDDVRTLRNKTADYILQNKDSLIFYMTNADTGNCLNDTEFEKYCSDLRNTAAWGGQIEISALSQVLQVPIEVIQATGPPTIQGDDKFKGPNLVITYHRNMFSLGEHYNGTRLSNKNSTDDENDE